MSSTQVEDICKSLVGKRVWPIKQNEIEEIWGPIKEKLNSKEQMQLLICLSKENYIFPYLRLMSYVIPSLSASEDGFIELLGNVVAKVKNDLAQGDFVKGLIDLGEKQSDQAIELYKSLIKTGDSSLIHYSGLILGGAAKKDFQKVFATIREDFPTGFYPVQVACIKALRVGLEKSDFSATSEEVFALLKAALGQPDDSLKIEAIQAYIDFDKVKPDLCEETLKDVAKTGPSLLRLVIIDRLWLTSLEKRENEIEILKLCSQDDDQRVIESIARVLSKKGQSFLGDSLEIIKELLKKPYYVHGPMFDYYLREFGKGKLDTILESIKQWVKDDKDKTMSFKVSMALGDFATSENMEELRSILKTWIEGGDLSLQRIALFTTIDLFEKGHFSKERCEEDFSLLKTLKEEPIRTELESELWSLFSGRPLFTGSETVIRVISDWARDPDWRIRKTIVHSLSSLAENRIDSEETLHLLINKETKESKVAGITTKKITTPEGIVAYDLLKELTADREKEVQILAKNEIERVNARLKEKEAAIDERILKQAEAKEPPKVKGA